MCADRQLQRLCLRRRLVRANEAVGLSENSRIQGLSVVYCGLLIVGRCCSQLVVRRLGSLLSQATRRGGSRSVWKRASRNVQIRQTIAIISNKAREKWRSQSASRKGFKSVYRTA